MKIDGELSSKCLTILSLQHHLKLDPNKCTKLKNRNVMGSIEPMRITKRPVAPVIQEIASFATSSDVQV